MIAFAGADLVLPDRVVRDHVLVVDGGRIADITSSPPSAARTVHIDAGTIVPGFVDAHVHGACGIDTLDAGSPIADLAAVLPQFGTTAFAPTTVACAPDDLQRVLLQVRACRTSAPGPAARVLPAHLESNFINPHYRGAQPLECLRTFTGRGSEASTVSSTPTRCGTFAAADVMRVIKAHADAIGVVTLAPEMEGGLRLMSELRHLGIAVSLGHSGASFAEAHAAIAAGATRATHLFNGMSALHHRAPGLPGAVLDSTAVVAELICDGAHVHPALIRMVLATRRRTRVMAVSDGTAAAGLPAGATARLGVETITAGPDCARLSDGTMAGSVATMDRVLRLLIRDTAIPIVDAVHMCATTPAHTVGLEDAGRLEPGMLADLAVLDAESAVVQTWVNGQLAWSRNRPERPSV